MADTTYVNGNKRIVKNMNVFVGTLAEIHDKVENKEVEYLDFLISTDTYELYIGSKSGKAVCVGTGRSINKEEITKLVKSVAAEQLSRIKTALEAVITNTVDEKVRSLLETVQSDIAILNTNQETLGRSLQTLSNNDSILNNKITSLKDTKLDKIVESADHERLYSVSSQGVQEMKLVSSLVIPNAVVSRTADGQIILPDSPIDDNHAVSKKYLFDNFMSLSGDNFDDNPISGNKTFTGNVYVASSGGLFTYYDITEPNHVVNKAYLDLRIPPLPEDTTKDYRLMYRKGQLIWEEIEE